MKYFVINTTYKDGEYEYLQQSPIEAETRREAMRLASLDAREWTEHDYREFEIDVRAEISEEEYKVISKYIY